MNANGDEEDGDETEEDNGMDKNGGPTCLHIPELDDFALRRKLKQQPRTQQYEQHNRYQHWSPIRHFCFDLVCLSSVLKLCLFRWMMKLSS